jgi:phosphatidate phosphatase LPIN
MSPDGLISSFKREVIDRTPQRFKIECLTQILNLFPSDESPYFCGFGNKITDAIAYEAVGVNKNKIFIINEKGKINQFNKFYKTTYTDIDDMVEQMFPNMKSYNTYNGDLNYFKPSVKFNNLDDLFK